MSNKNGPPSPDTPFNHYSIWSGMAGSIAALIISTVLSLNQSRHDTSLEPSMQDIISKFSEEANNFLTALDHFCIPATQSLPPTQTNYLIAATSSKQSEGQNKELINLGRNKRVNKMNTYDKDDADINSNKHSTEEEEETAQVCVIEEEISEVSDYTLDPVTNRIKISTVEEYSKLATCTVIRNQGIQAYNCKEEEGEEAYPDQQIGDTTKVHYKNEDEITQNEKAHLEEPDEPKVNIIERDKIYSEPYEEIILESASDTQKESTSHEDKPIAKILFENNLSQGIKNENEKVSSVESDASLSEGAEAVLMKKLTDALTELKSKKVTVENENLPPEISETSLSEGLEETRLKEITKTFSTIKEVEEVPNQNDKVASRVSETFMSPSIEETILKKLTETLSELKPKPLSTSSISINTIEKFPVETADRATEVEPETTNVSTQNTQTVQNVPIKQNIPNVQNIELKVKIKKNTTTSEVPTNKPNNVVKRDKSKEPTEKIPPKRRTGAGAAEELEKLIPKPRNWNKKDQKSKSPVKPGIIIEENKRRNSSKSRPPAKPPK